MLRVHVPPAGSEAGGTAPGAWSTGTTLVLAEGAARHVQVLRLQPGDALVLFDGRGGEWSATVGRIGRREVEVVLGAHEAVERELPVAVTVALGMPANERMDALVEKATELGAAAIQPLLTARSVLRLAGERAERRRAHWAGIAAAACEQCGRNRVPAIGPVCTLETWLATIGPARSTAAPAPGTGARWLLAPGSRQTIAGVGPMPPALLLLSGPEGGLDDGETQRAIAAGFEPIGLGPRVLRADTAPLAALAQVALRTG